jgi:tagatose 6-phosphate kinase
LSANGSDGDLILAVGENLAWQKTCTIPPLGRGLVHRVGEVRAFASSKGPNVVRALAGVGGRGEVIGYAGGATGRRVEEYLDAEGLAHSFVRIAAETRICTTYIEPDGTCTEMIEPSPAVTEAEREELQRLFRARIAHARMFFIMGTAVAGESEDCYARMIRAAHERGTPVLMDSVCAAARHALRESPEILKINAHELGELTGAGVATLADRVAACRALRSRHGIRWVLVSRGREGIEAFDGEHLFSATPPDVDVLNAIGSGDAAAAGVGWVLCRRMRDDPGAARPADAALRSAEALREALLTATAMGTANCLNPINGRVMREDYLAVRARVAITEPGIA